MSRYYYNEKEGRYDPISKASYAARIKHAKSQQDDLTEGIRKVQSRSNQSFQELKRGYHSEDVEKAARQTSDYSSYTSNERKEPEKKKKGGIISFAFIVWLLYMFFRNGAGESIREFFANLF